MNPPPLGPGRELKITCQIRELLDFRRQSGVFGNVALSDGASASGF